MSVFVLGCASGARGRYEGASDNHRPIFHGCICIKA